ncbi:synaptonemal complex protein 2 isoform X2 [Lissotriton helveticus]
MPVKEDLKLEQYIDDASRKNNFQPLEDILQAEFCCNVTQKCSKQFFIKLDKLISRELDNKYIKNVSTLLNVIQRFASNISIQGEDGLTSMIKQGLVQTMVPWFEKLRHILTCEGTAKNEDLLNLVEDFFDALMIIDDVHNDGKIEMLETFVLRICSLIADTRINVFIQQEAVRKLNVMLDTMPRECKKNILSTEKLLPIMNDMGKRILDAGDYDLQVAITEALCRMTSEKQRADLAAQWFQLDFVANAFKGIKDTDFETDCRKFLNQVNGMLGSKRRVFTYPCLSAFLETYELQMPQDEKLEEFWIDFNIGSRSISFYIAADNGEDHQWETVSILEEEVDTYSVEGVDMQSKALLNIALKNPMKIGCKEGSIIKIYFDSALDVLEVTRKIYGASKCKGFTKKQSISVAKTAVHIIFDESGSQILIPESQVLHSPANEEYSLEDESKPLEEKFLSALMDTKQNTAQEEIRSVEPEMITPYKRKMSEASMVIFGTGGLTINSPLPAARTSTPRKGRVKPPLTMVNSADSTTLPLKLENEDRQKQSPEVHQNITRETFKSGSNIEKYRHPTKDLSIRDNKLLFQRSGSHDSRFQKRISAAEVAEMLQNEEKDMICQKGRFDEKTDVVPDSQPRRKDKPLLPGLLDGSFDEHKRCSKRTSLTSDKVKSNLAEQKNSPSSGIAFQQDQMFSDQVIKQRAFYSIFEGKDSPKQEMKKCGKNVNIEHNLRESLEELKKENDEAVTVRPLKNPLQMKTNSRHVLKSKEQTDFCRKSATSFEDSHLASTVEEHGKCSIKPKTATDVCNTIKSFKKDTRIRRSEQTIGPDHTSSTRKPRQMESQSQEFMVAAESIISTIGSKYTDKGRRTCARKSKESLAVERFGAENSFLLETKGKGHNRGFRQLTTTINLNLTREQFVDDVYSFNLSGSDEPTIKLGVDEFSTTKENSLSTKKKQDVSSRDLKVNSVKKTRNQHGKKHLFSDTDTETRCDDSKTDISWLRESNRKQKPKLLGYSRNKMVPKQEVPRKYTSPVKCLQKAKTRGETKVIDRSKTNAKTAKRNADERVPKRPRRATVKNKSYKELSNSETESEVESIKPSSLMAEKSRNLHHNVVEKQSKTRTVLDKLAAEHSNKKLNGRPNQPTTTRTGKITDVPIPSPMRPASVEKMRSEEYYSETEFSLKHSSLARSTSSSLEDLSSGKSESPLKIKSLSTDKFYTTVMKNYDKPIKKQTENTFTEQTRNNESSSPDFSPLSLTTLTLPTLDQYVASGLDTDINIPQFVSEEKQDAPLDTSCYLSGKEPIESDPKNLGANVKSRRQGKKPPSGASTSSDTKEKPADELSFNIVHRSGPTTRTATDNLKRMCSNASESGDDENHETEQEDEVERKESLHPKKIFKVTVQDQVSCRVSESISTVSGHEISVIDCDSWEAGSSDVGTMCQKISKEFTRKMQNRSRKMDHFAKQSMQSAQQHMTSMSFQIRECRINRLDKFHCTVLEELEHFEKDAQSLKHLEKEFTNFMKQQATVFGAYHRSEQHRIHHLKSSFEKNVPHSIDYEENIFTSEMRLMREDMKAVQDRLLKETQEEELLNVRRGLQSLFMTRSKKF